MLIRLKDATINLFNSSCFHILVNLLQPHVSLVQSINPFSVEGLLSSHMNLRVHFLVYNNCWQKIICFISVVFINVVDESVIHPFKVANAVSKAVFHFIQNGKDCLHLCSVRRNREASDQLPYRMTGRGSMISEGSISCPGYKLVTTSWHWNWPGFALEIWYLRQEDHLGLANCDITVSEA